MDGIFLKNQFMKLIHIAGVISGLFLVLLFIFLIFVDSAMTLDDIILSIFFIVFGFIVLVMSSIFLFFNHKAFLHIENDHISARFNWNTKIEYEFSEIAFVDYSLFSLSLCLKNGKRYTVLNLENAALICSEIRKKIYTSNTITNKEELDSEISKLLAARNKWLIFVIIGIVMMFLNIFICVVLTGEKEFSAFTKNEWIVFWVFIGCEFLVMSFMFFTANKCGKLLPIINEKRVALKKVILENERALPGNVKSVHIDSYYTGRITVFEIPSVTDVYYCVEEFDKNYALIETYRSPLFSSIDELTPMIEEFIQI